MRWYSGACPVCHGDLYEDPMDAKSVTCMMCAREFVAADVLAVQRARRVETRVAVEMLKQSA